MMCYFTAAVAVFFMCKWIAASSDLRCVNALYRELLERQANGVNA